MTMAELDIDVSSSGDGLLYIKLESPDKLILTRRNRPGVGFNH